MTPHSDTRPINIPNFKNFLLNKKDKIRCYYPIIEPEGSSTEESVEKGFIFEPKQKLISESEGSTDEIEIIKATDKCSYVSVQETNSEETSLKKYIEAIFHYGTYEDLESGRDSIFSVRLENALKKYGNEAIDLIKEFIEENRFNVEILSYSLRIIGDFKNQQFIDKQLEILAFALKHPSPIIRDSSALGFIDLGYTGAIEFLKDAMKNEKYSMLKKDYEQAIYELGAI